jgi:hypothetical protein
MLRLPSSSLKRRELVQASETLSAAQGLCSMKFAIFVPPSVKQEAHHISSYLKNRLCSW